MAIVQADGRRAMSGLERGTSVFRAKLWLPGQERSETVGGKYRSDFEGKSLLEIEISRIFEERIYI